MLKKFRKVLLSCTSLMMLIGNTNIFVNAEDTESSDAQITIVEDEKEDETIEDTIDDSSSITEWKYEDDEITVTVETQIDALPENSELFVTKLDAEKVDELQNEDAEEAVGYDIGFTNEGEEVEPTSEAQVNIQLKTETLGEDIDVDNVNVQHIKDDENVDTVANKEKENISEENGVINTTFTTESFSYFIINYNNNYKIYAHLIDTAGTEFPASASDQFVVRL